MTKAEFKSEFHTKWNNINSNMAPGVSDKELAQMANSAYISIVKSLYNGTLSEFETNEETRAYLDTLVKQGSMTPVSSAESHSHIVDDSKLFTTPNDVMFVVYESAKITDNSNPCITNRQVVVKPVTHDQFWSIYNNPFKGSNDRKILRITHSETANNVTVEYYELVTKYAVSEYVMRYVALPEQISDIFTSTSEDICALPKSLHNTLVDYTVNIAKQIWS